LISRSRDGVFQSCKLQPRVCFCEGGGGCRRLQPGTWSLRQGLPPPRCTCRCHGASHVRLIPMARRQSRHRPSADPVIFGSRLL
jgi:hypothetical protein